MATKAGLPENFPVTVNNKVQFVNKAKYAAAVAAELAVVHKADISKKHITDMLGLIERGEELASENEPIWHEVYKRLESDVDKGRAYTVEAAEAAKQEEAKKAELEKKQKDREASLVAVAEKTDTGKTFLALPELFDLGNMDRCIAKKDVTDEQLVGALKTSLNMDNFTNWAKGDLVNQLAARGLEGVMVQMSATQGIPYKTLWRMAQTAKIVPADRRKEGVSFTVYAEIATAKLAKDEKERDAQLAELLGNVDSGVIANSQAAREAVMKAQGKTGGATNKAPEIDTEKHVFIGIDGNGQPSRMEGLHKTAEDFFDIIIHARTAKVKEGKKWVDMDTWEPEPEPEPAPEPASEPKKPAKKTSKKAAAAAK